MKNRIFAIGIAAVLGICAPAFVEKAAAQDTMTVEHFTDAFKDNHFEFKNTYDMEKFIAQLVDGYQGYEYKNVTNYDKFVAALGDDYTGYSYVNTMKYDNFVAALEDPFANQVIETLVPKVRCNDQIKLAAEEGTIVLAKLQAAKCE